MFILDNGSQPYRYGLPVQSLVAFDLQKFWFDVRVSVFVLLLVLWVNKLVTGPMI